MTNKTDKFEISREQLDDLDPSGRWVYTVRPLSDILSNFTFNELVNELIKRGATKWHRCGTAMWGTTHEEIVNGTAKYTKPETYLIVGDDDSTH